jgi:transposase
MIVPPSGVRVWLATGVTDMRRGMNSLALQVQGALHRDPHAGDLYVFRGKRGDLLNILWHDGLGMSLYAKRLERGKFIWPSPSDGVVPISAAQLGYMLEGIDRRHPQRTWRPEFAACHRRTVSFRSQLLSSVISGGNRERQKRGRTSRCRQILTR